MTAAAYSGNPQDRPLSYSTPEVIMSSPQILDLQINQIQMKLLHTYSTSTCYTLARTIPVQTVWRVNVPQIAFSSDYVMHTVLALAALHVAYCQPEHKQTYINYALQLHEAALRKATLVLPNLTDDNCVELYTFAAVSCFVQYAKPRPDGPPLIAGDDEQSDFMMISRGTRTILDCVKDREVLQSSIVGPLFSLGIRRRSARDAMPRKTHNSLAALRLLITESISDPTAIDIYTSAIEELERAIPHDMSMEKTGWEVSDILHWLYLVSDEYVDLLSQRTPQAMIIFGYFCAFLKDIESAWWMKGWSFYLISRIYYALDEDSRIWLQWPMEQLGWLPG